MDYKLMNQNTELIELNSSEFNSINETLCIDLNKTFEYIDKVKKMLNSNFFINKASTSNMKISLEKINNKLDAIEKTILEKDNPLHYIETFNDNSSIENNMYFYKERYGETIDKRNVVTFDKYEESITLPLLSKDNKIISSNGNILANISVKFYTGKNLYSVENNDKLINAIDTSMTTFWQQTILTDTPIKIQFDDAYYNIKNGAVCELELNFEGRTSVNEICMDPFVKYPIEIIGIRYKETDSPDEMLKNIVYPENTFENLRNRIIDKSLSYKFETIICKKIYIVFRQIHYTKFTGNFNLDKLFKNKLWYSLVNQEIENNNALFKPIIDEKLINDKLYEYLSKTSTNDFNKNTFSKLFESKQKSKLISKFQYDYGFYNISAFLNDFANTGIYISKPISTKSNINKIRILTEEYHPKDVLGNLYTDIEYYISFSDNPKVNDWLPILPANKTEIKNELLQKVLGKYSLRFPAAEIKNIFFNGIPLRTNYDYYTNLNKDGNIISIEIPNSDPFSLYTAHYIPITSASTINTNLDFLSTRNTEEVIYCTGDSHYSLLNIPSLNKNANIHLSIVNTENGDMYSEENGYIINVTNKVTPNESYKNFVKGTLIQYYVDKNFIYLNQEFKAPHVLVINYDNYVSTFRLKSILRRNIDASWITPSIYKINYEVNIIE